MQEISGYKTVKDFLSYNNKNFSSGHVLNETFYVEYYVDDELRYQGNEIVNFQVQHPEFTDDISIIHLDANIYHTGFRAKYQKYIFDKENNILIIDNQNSNNKFGKSFQVIIHGEK
jgi:hypothetical protein